MDNISSNKPKIYDPKQELGFSVRDGQASRRITSLGYDSSDLRSLVIQSESNMKLGSFFLFNSALAYCPVHSVLLYK